MHMQDQSLVTLQPRSVVTQQEYAERGGSYDMIAGWIRDFNDGRDDFKDKGCFGRPSTSVNKGSATRAAAILMEDTSVTIGCISAKLGISVGSTPYYCMTSWGSEKKRSRCIPHELTADLKKRKVSIFLPAQPIQSKWAQKCFRCCYERWMLDALFCDTSQPEDHGLVGWGWSEDRIFWTLVFKAGRECFTIFFNTRGPIMVDIMPEGATPSLLPTMLTQF